MNTRRVAAGKLSEIEKGGMKQVSTGKTEVLLARINDECFAVGAYCPHYGAPLVDGTLNGGRLVCPWHHACFDVRTGRREEPPAFDSLPKFEVTIEDDQIFVHVPEDASDRITAPMTKRNPADQRVFLILGGGAAGYMAAQTLREDGFEGRVAIVSAEDRVPYDRPNLSKDYLQGHAEPAWMPLRSEEFYAEHDIETLLGKTAADVNFAAKQVTFEDGEAIRFDSLLIATGGVARRLPVQSDAHENVFLLRSFADTDAIIAAAGEGAKAVVIGTSFIGMEAAASLKTRACEVTVIGLDTVPFAKTLGREIGELFRHVHEQNGVKFRLGANVESFAGESKVEAVVLAGGERIEADIVIVGVGVAPATDFLRGIELHKDGGVIADNHLRIAPDVYAAGDIAHFPDPRTGELTRIEHWRTAMQQGQTAAHNMAGKSTPYTAVPFFWTTQFDTTLNYVGHVKDWDRIVFQGDVEKQDFLAFYVKGHRILAVAGMNRDRDIAVWEELIRLNRVPSPSAMSGDDANISRSFHERPGYPAVSTL